MVKIKIKRRGHHRRGYRRFDGTWVSKTYVHPTEFYVDTSKLGSYSGRPILKPKKNIKMLIREELKELLSIMK